MIFSDEQKLIIHSTEKRMVVHACPGSGKTTTSAGYIAHRLKEHKESGFEFLAITFSRFASAQLQQKVSELDPSENWKITVNTFHGFALDVISRFAARQYQVVTDEDLVFIMDDCGYWTGNKPFKDFKNGKIVSPAEFSEYREKFNKIMESYGWITYSQILDRLLGNEKALEWIRNKYRYLIVDEAQDMNPQQMRLAEAMNIDTTMYIGDVSQAIYEWNGASPKILMSLANRYPSYSLSTNYRSAKKIITASESLISNNALKFDEANNAYKANDGDLTVIHVNGWMEQSGAAQEASRFLLKDNKPSDIAILCRTNAEVNEILKSSDIPMAENMGSKGLRTDTGILIVLAITRVRMQRSKAAYLLLERALAKEYGFEIKKDKWAFARSNNEIKSGFKPWVLDAIYAEDFRHAVNIARANIGPGAINPEKDIVGHVMGVFGETEYDYDENSFLRWFATVSAQDLLSNDDDRIQVMTIHQAKGLEFKHVITPLPKEGGSDEEARRIVYVAWTRAEESLTIISSRENHQYLKEACL